LRKSAISALCVANFFKPAGDDHRAHAAGMIWLSFGPPFEDWEVAPQMLHTE
jgi:hypothetical protein